MECNFEATERAGDVALYFGTTPPCFRPLSPRAKQLFLDYAAWGADAYIVLGATAEEVLSAFPEDFVITETDIRPDLVLTLMIEALH
jgi:hypothetical protein